VYLASVDVPPPSPEVWEREEVGGRVRAKTPTNKKEQPLMAALLSLFTPVMGRIDVLR